MERSREILGKIKHHEAVMSYCDASCAVHVSAEKNAQQLVVGWSPLQMPATRLRSLESLSMMDVGQID
jgi:hypothetical protein